QRETGRLDRLVRCRFHFLHCGRRTGRAVRQRRWLTILELGGWRSGLNRWCGEVLEKLSTSCKIQDRIPRNIYLTAARCSGRGVARSRNAPGAAMRCTRQTLRTIMDYAPPPETVALVRRRYAEGAFVKTIVAESGIK